MTAPIKLEDRQRGGRGRGRGGHPGPNHGASLFEATPTSSPLPGRCGHSEGSYSSLSETERFSGYKIGGRGCGGAPSSNISASTPLPGGSDHIAAPSPAPPTSIPRQGGVFDSTQAAPRAGSTPRDEDSPLFPALLHSSATQVKMEGEKKQSAGGGRFCHNSIPDFGTAVTTVRVGKEPNHTDFTVHENLLRRSPYFTAALNSRNEKAFIALDTGKPKAFGIYVQWLYSNRLHTKLSHQGNLAVSQSHREEWARLVDVYLIGNLVSDVDFRDVIMDAMLGWFEEADANDLPVLLSNIDDIFDIPNSVLLVTSSQVRELVTDIAAWHFSEATIQSLKLKSFQPKLPYDFILVTLVKLSTRFQGQSGLIAKFGRVSLGNDSPVKGALGSCRYHSHGDVKCYKDK